MTVVSGPVITITTSASSVELYSHLPAHSVTHRNSDSTEGRAKCVPVCDDTPCYNTHVSMFSFPNHVGGLSLLVLDTM